MNPLILSILLFAMLAVPCNAQESKFDQLRDLVSSESSINPTIRQNLNDLLDIAESFDGRSFVPPSVLDHLLGAFVWNLNYLRENGLISFDTFIEAGILGREIGDENADAAPPPAIAQGADPQQNNPAPPPPPAGCKARILLQVGNELGVVIGGKFNTRRSSTNSRRLFAEIMGGPAGGAPTIDWSIDPNLNLATSSNNPDRATFVPNDRGSFKIALKVTFGDGSQCEDMLEFIVR